MASFYKNREGKWVPVPEYFKQRVTSLIYLVSFLFAVTLIAFVGPALALTLPKHLQSRLKTLPEVRTIPKSKTPKKSQLISPQYGHIKLGAFAAEAANLAGLKHISTTGLAQHNQYRLYRESIRHTYGVDLEDMNYFSLAPDGLAERLVALEKWIFMAGEYGDVTVALEPLGPETYQAFYDPLLLIQLESIFKKAQSKGITVYVRFASESNLRLSEYSATRNPEIFYQAAAAFKSQMPKNVKLVFSPLINTVVSGKKTQAQLMKQMLYGPNHQNVLWDRIGGTLYRTNLPLERTFNTYYELMVELDPETPFQLCELGGPYNKKTETIQFLNSCSNGTYPRLKKVNLFARNINQRADPLAEFGFLEPTERATKSRVALSTQVPQKMESFLKSEIKQRQQD